MRRGFRSWPRSTSACSGETSLSCGGLQRQTPPAGRQPRTGRLTCSKLRHRSASALPASGNAPHAGLPARPSTRRAPAAADADVPNRDPSLGPGRQHLGRSRHGVHHICYDATTLKADLIKLGETALVTT